MFSEWLLYILTVVLVLEILLKVIAFGFVRFLKVGWNVLDVLVVLVSIHSIVLTQLKLSDKMPINPSFLHAMRILRFAYINVPKTWKMIALFKTIIWTFLEVGHLDLLLIVFCIYAVVGVELFGKLECSPDFPCPGPNGHTSFENFEAALLSLCHVSIGHNLGAIIKDTMRGCHGSDSDCNYSYLVSLTYFSTFLSMFHVMFVKLVVAWYMRTALR